MMSRQQPPLYRIVRAALATTAPPASDPLRDAAPELLAVLRLAEERLAINDCEGEEAPHLAVIRAASAKAEGRS